MKKIEIKKVYQDFWVVVDGVKTVTLYPRYCKKHGRLKLPKGRTRCPECNTETIRSSRYEWILTDELRRVLRDRFIDWCNIRNSRKYHHRW